MALCEHVQAVCFDVDSTLCASLPSHVLVTQFTPTEGFIVSCCLHSHIPWQHTGARMNQSMSLLLSSMLERLLQL